MIDESKFVDINLGRISIGLCSVVLM